MLQIDCSRYKCYKAVEVCYWSCKFRPKCKDWQNALNEKPGIDAISTRLQEASKKTGRIFDLVTLTSSAGSKKRMRRAPQKPTQIYDKGALHTPMFDTIDEIVDEIPKTESIDENSSEKNEKKAVNGNKKTKAKPAKPAKPKPAKAKQEPPPTDGPIFLLLYPNGKYKELSESELPLEAASVVKDGTLRLIKGKFLVPMISFKDIES